MVISVVYKKDYADFENGEDDEISISSAYKNRRKAVKRAKDLLNEFKQKNLYLDEEIKNKRNPFKNNNCVDFYKQRTNQEYRTNSIIIEETKLIA